MATHTLPRAQAAHAQVPEDTAETVQTTVTSAYDAGRNMHITAQYLYDNLVNNETAERTRMEIVRKAVETVDTANFKQLLGDMVKIADSIPDERVKKAKKKTAMNTQTVLRSAYGALKFAPTELATAGYTDRTGYNDMAVFAKTALTTKGIRWDGTTRISNDQKALDKRQVEDELVLAKLKKDNPQRKTPDGKDFAESAKDYNERILELLDQGIAAHKAETLNARVETACRDIIKRYRDLLDPIGDKLYEIFDQVQAEEVQAAQTALEKANMH